VDTDDSVQTVRRFLWRLVVSIDAIDRDLGSTHASVFLLALLSEAHEEGDAKRDGSHDGKDQGDWELAVSVAVATTTASAEFLTLAFLDVTLHELSLALF